MILDYNRTKGGVDSADKLCSLLTARRWPCSIFYTLLNLIGINAQVLFFIPTSPVEDQCSSRIWQIL